MKSLLEMTTFQSLVLIHDYVLDKRHHLD